MILSHILRNAVVENKKSLRERATLARFAARPRMESGSTASDSPRASARAEVAAKCCATTTEYRRWSSAPLPFSVSYRTLRSFIHSVPASPTRHVLSQSLSSLFNRALQPCCLASSSNVEDAVLPSTDIATHRFVVRNVIAVCIRDNDVSNLLIYVSL